MIPHRGYRLPDEKHRMLQRAVRLEWITIGFLISITIVMYLAMGSSQAMKTAWVEDILSLVPPISFLVAMRFRNRDPDLQHPWGYRRATLLSFLMAAVAILMLGLFLLYDAASALLTRHHPTIGHFDLFGWHLWAGWVMIAALIYSILPVIVLGHMKIDLGKKLHEKTLYADADMNKADWTTAVAAIVGVLGVGAGLWWADAAAAAFIAAGITRDGVKNIRRAMGDLMDGRPRAADTGEPLHLEHEVARCVESLEGIRHAAARLREDGHVITGEVLVVLASEHDVAQRLEHASAVAGELDWRLHGLVMVPVSALPEDSSTQGPDGKEA